MFLIAFPIVREQTQHMVTGALAEDVTVPTRARTSRRAGPANRGRRPGRGRPR